MSTTTLRFSLVINGAPADATSVVLSDPTAAFGLRRTDTNAVVIAAGTAFTHAATGLYTYTLTDPAAGLTYEYWITYVIASETYRQQKFSQGGGPSSAGNNGAYLDTASARSLAAKQMGVPGLATLLALDDPTLAGVLLTSSSDIDLGMRYQGRKYDPTQLREFPRVAFGSTPGVNQFGVPLAGPASLPLTPDTVVWDWDYTNNAVIVPTDVQLATLFQACWLMQPKYAARIEAIQSGLVSQEIGTGAEAFAKASEIAGGVTGLGDRSRRILMKYRLMTGRML